MKRILLFAFSITLSAVPALASSDQKVGPYSLTGQPTLIDFWASWCQPCRESFPVLRKIQSDFSGKVQFVAINMDKEETDRIQFLKENPLSFEHLVDLKRDLKKQFEVKALPTTLVFDSKGKEILRLRGYEQKHEEKIRKALKSALDPHK